MVSHTMSINTNKRSVDDFDNIYLKLTSQIFTTDVITTFDGDNISIGWIPPTKKNSIMDEIHSSLKCNTCYQWMRSVGRMRFKNGKTPFSFIENSDSLYYQMSHSDFHLKYQWKLFDKKVIGTPSGGVNPSTGKSWNHFYVTLSDDSVGKYLKFSKSDYNWYFSQKLPILRRLVEENANDGILDSLILLLEALPDIPYGNKIEASTKWFYQVMEKYLDKYYKQNKGYRKETIFFMKSLVSSPLLKGVDSERIIFTHLKQVKDNVLDALASVDDIPSLKALLKSRFDPHNYMRPTATPSSGQLEKAMKDFEGFSSSVMTLDEVITKYGGVLVPQIKVSTDIDASRVFQSMIPEKNQPKRRKAGEFSERAGVTSKVNFPKTFRQLIQRIEKFPNLLVKTNKSPIMLSTYPEHCRHLFKNPHLWCFFNGKKISMFKVYDDFSPVNVLYSIDGHAFVGLSKAGLPVGKFRYNTCFPIFLHPSYQRTHRVAFETLNTKLPINVPNEPLMIGIGSSVSTSGKKLFQPLTFKFNGRIYDISMM